MNDAIRRRPPQAGAKVRGLTFGASRCRVLFDGSPLALIVFDPASLGVLAVNAACQRVAGYPADTWLGQPFCFAVDGEQREALQASVRRLQATATLKAVAVGGVRLRHCNGYWLEMEGVLQRFDGDDGYAQILVLQDLSERRKTEEYLRLLAKEQRQRLEQAGQYDTLTGLPSRMLLDERLRQGVVQSHLTGCSLAVCYLDIDGFAQLNATYGREVGDHLLINTAECLRSCLRGGDTLVRIGSDDFVLLVLGIRNDADVERFVRDLQERLAEPFVSDTAVVQLGASIGVTVYPRDNADANTLLRHALQAMIDAKQDGGGVFRRFDPDSDRRVRARRETIDSLRVALARREFVLYYQPKVDLRDMRVVGAEALIRWQHPERGVLPPGAFLPDIENDEVMIDVGYWVIGEALAQMDRWRAQGLDLAVSVNIAAQHFLEPHFIARLRGLLAEHPATPPGRLEIEVLETSAIDDVDHVERIIVACHAMGIGFSLDDFGTGYSSLTYLRRLSADTLKIDQTFVAKMLVDTGDKAIISGVVGLAAAFQRQVIAEGVESVAHAHALCALGCFLVQGYAIARPMPAEALPSWHARWPDDTWADFSPA